ncbi:MAG TPA: transposase family protein [Candidatus Saccharimonadales bacterium]|nr:transposase family protein [Candidatus Saccharimonadales bacterium]
MSMDTELQKHYALLLGIGSPWEVKAVELKLTEKKVEIELGWQWGSAAQCPDCGCECSIHDSAPERTWRHLDTMQFTTLIRARTPRAECPEHGVKTMQVPWAVPQGRFTLLFERFAVEVLLACANVSQACELLGIGWDAHEIMRRAVERGLERRQMDQLAHLGMDEKSFKRGHSYIKLLTDLDQSRVLGGGGGTHLRGGGPVVGRAHTGTESGGGSGGGGHVGAVHPDDCQAGAGGGHCA